MAISSPEMMLVPVELETVDCRVMLMCVLTQIDVTERTAANLAADSVFVSDTEIL